MQEKTECRIRYYISINADKEQIGEWENGQNPSFEDLSDSILQTHQYAQTAAIRAVNQFATLRNWLIGCYIVEYEQKGKDRAQYGERLLKRLEESPVLWVVETGAKFHYGAFPLPKGHKER